MYCVCKIYFKNQSYFCSFLQVNADDHSPVSPPDILTQLTQLYINYEEAKAVTTAQLTPAQPRLTGTK